MTDDEVRRCAQSWSGLGILGFYQWKRLFEFSLERSLTNEEVWDIIRRWNSWQSKEENATTYADIVRSTDTFWRSQKL